MSFRRTSSSALVAALWFGAAATALALPSPVSTLVGYERTHEHNSDVEQPQCFVLQIWAQCSFGTGHGNAEVNAWLKWTGSAWRFLGSGGGVTTAQMLEQQYGIPAAIARRFQAKQ